MTYLAIYLTIGSSMAIALYITQLISEHRSSLRLSREVSKALFPRRHTFRYHLINHVTVPLISCVVVAITWPLALFIKARMWLGLEDEDSCATKVALEPEFQILREHLHERLSVEEVECRERVFDPLGAVPNIPFGYLHAQWTAVRNALGPADEIWSFSVCEASEWKRLEERSGYVVVRPDGIGPAVLTAWKMPD